MLGQVLSGLVRLGQVWSDWVRICQALSGFSAYRPRILLVWLVDLVWHVYICINCFQKKISFQIAGWRSRPSTLTTSPTLTTHGRPSQPPSTPSASMSSPRDSSINRIGQILSTVGWAAQDLQLGLGLCSGMGSTSSLTLRPWGGSLKFGTLPVVRVHKYMKVQFLENTYS